MARCAIAFLAMLVLNLHSAVALDDLLSELEDVYLVVLTDSISVTRKSNRVYVVALHDSEGQYIPMPDSLWKTLAKRLEAKGTDVSVFAKPEDVDWAGDQLDSLLHKPTGKRAWVYSIRDVTWEGTSRLYVRQMLHHGVLIAEGSTLVLEKQNGKWTIVDRINKWDS